MVPVIEKDEMTFEVAKAGQYFYVRVKRLLRQMGIDYENEKEATSFDIDEMKNGETKYFKLSMRKKKANKSD